MADKKSIIQLVSEMGLSETPLNFPLKMMQDVGESLLNASIVDLFAEYKQCNDVKDKVKIYGCFNNYAKYVQDRLVLANQKDEGIEDDMDDFIKGTGND